MIANDPLRDEAPVQCSEAQQAWTLTSYADIVAILRDPSFSAAACLQMALHSLPRAARAELATITSIVSRTLAYLDPPRHTRMRRLVNVIYQPSVAEALRPRIREIVEELLDAAAQSGEMDIVADFAYPLSARIIAEMFALPAEDWRMLARAADAFTALSGPAFEQADARRLAEAAISDLSAYFRRAIAQRRARPAADLLSTLISQEEHGEKLDEDELTAACIMTLIGGHRSIRHTIATSLSTLQRCPKLRERLQINPSLVPVFVEESLRYYGGVAPYLTRVAQEDTRIGGKTIPRGQLVLLRGGAGNRDAAQFRDPEAFDPSRHPNHHLTFGSGIHRCPGAPLARVAVSIAVESMVRRLSA